MKIKRCVWREKEIRKWKRKNLCELKATDFIEEKKKIGNKKIKKKIFLVWSDTNGWSGLIIEIMGDDRVDVRKSKCLFLL